MAICAFYVMNTFMMGEQKTAYIAYSGIIIICFGYSFSLLYRKRSIQNDYLELLSLFAVIAFLLVYLVFCNV